MLRLPITINLLFLSLLQFSYVNSAGLKEEFTWTHINYVWPNNTVDCPNEDQNKQPSDFVFPTTYRAAKPGYFRFPNRNGVAEDMPEYTLENNIPMGVTHYKTKIFVTVPRRRPGVPSTLNYVSLDCSARHNVPLKPYPTWELNSLTTQRPEDPTDVHTPFVSVYRTTVDACDRLWFVDMGTLEYPTGRQQVQQFALIVMDLKTNKVIRRYPFKVSDVNPRATLASVAVDVTKTNCDDAFAYMPDLVNYKMMVYSWKENDSWQVSHNYFAFDPIQGDFSIGGVTFSWMDGIFSIALSKINKDGFRTAYFHPMASTNEFSVSTKILRDKATATRTNHGSDFHIAGNRGENGQSSTHDVDKQSGIMFMGEVHKYGLFCWDTSKPFTAANQGVIHQDRQKMIYPSDVEVDNVGNVWMMTNSLPVFIYGKLDYSKINFRIWTNSVKNAVAGTPCFQKSHY